MKKFFGTLKCIRIPLLVLVGLLATLLFVYEIGLATDGEAFNIVLCVFAMLFIISLSGAAVFAIVTGREKVVFYMATAFVFYFILRRSFMFIGEINAWADVNDGEVTTLVVFELFTILAIVGLMVFTLLGMFFEKLAFLRKFNIFVLLGFITLTLVITILRLHIYSRMNNNWHAYFHVLAFYLAAPLLFSFAYLMVDKRAFEIFDGIKIVREKPVKEEPKAEEEPQAEEAEEEKVEGEPKAEEEPQVEEEPKVEETEESKPEEKEEPSDEDTKE